MDLILNFLSLFCVVVWFLLRLNESHGTNLEKHLRCR